MSSKDQWPLGLVNELQRFVDLIGVNGIRFLGLVAGKVEFWIHVTVEISRANILGNIH